MSNTKNLSPVEAYELGIKDGKMLSLNRVMIEILVHDYSVDNIKSAINTMRDEITKGENDE